MEVVPVSAKTLRQAARSMMEGFLPSDTLVSSLASQERMEEEILSHRECAHTHCMDSPEITNWRGALPNNERG